MSYLIHDYCIIGGYDTSMFLFQTLQHHHDSILDSLVGPLSSGQSFFYPNDKTRFLRLNPKYHNLKTKESRVINIKDRMSVSLLEGFFRHCFKKSGVREFYVDPDLFLLIKKLRIKDKMFPYMKFFKFYVDLDNFIMISNQSKMSFIKTIESKMTLHEKVKSLRKWVQYIMEKKLEIEKKTIEYHKKISICQRACKKWLVKRKLFREIGDNWFRLLDRKERNMRIMSMNKITIDDKEFQFSPVRDVFIQRFDAEVIRVSPSDIIDYWSQFISNTMEPPSGNLYDRVCRTIVNHAKWNATILNWDLWFSQHSSTFCLFQKINNKYIEIDGQAYRSIGRRRIAKMYNGFNVSNSTYPVRPFGSLFNGIARGIHYHASHSLINKVIDARVVKNNQHLFWVKYGNKKKRDVAIVIKNVHWVRNEESYYHKYKTERYVQNSKNFNNEKRFTVDYHGIHTQDSHVDTEYTKWVQSLYDSVDLIWDNRNQLAL